MTQCHVSQRELNLPLPIRVGCRSKDRIELFIVEVYAVIREMLCEVMRCIILSLLILTRREDGFTKALVVHGETLELHRVLCERTCLIGEDILHLPKFFVEITGLHATFRVILRIAFQRLSLDELHDFQRNDQRDWDEVREDQHPASHELNSFCEAVRVAAATGNRGREELQVRQRSTVSLQPSCSVETRA